MKRAVRFAVLFGVRYMAHNLADFWLQPHEQAKRKGADGAAGAAACGKHVATYTLTNLVAVALANRLFRLGLTARGIAAGELVSAVTHFTADRRENGALFWLARWMRKDDYIENGGVPALDQSWHHVFNGVAAAITAVVDEAGTD